MPNRMLRVRTVPAIRRTLDRWTRRGERVAFVPTMGAIHAGHLALVRRAAARADRVVVSVFVNPLQFRAGEDFRRYPRPVRRDRALLASAGVDLLWEPRVADLYPPDDQTRVNVRRLSRRFEGESRPGHFEGVATVVLKLLHAVRPDTLWLGQKDAQQARVIEQMVADLLLPVRVRRGPTVREPDGLACSSRNRYLNEAQRQHALALPRGLEAARNALRAGERSAARLRTIIRREWRNHAGVREDYIAVVDVRTLEPLRVIRGRVLVAVAARLGRARLIDNFEWAAR